MENMTLVASRDGAGQPIPGATCAHEQRSEYRMCSEYLKWQVVSVKEKAEKTEQIGGGKCIVLRSLNYF